MLQGFPFASSSSMTLQGTSLSEILAFVHNGFFGNEALARCGRGLLKGVHTGRQGLEGACLEAAHFKTSLEAQENTSRGTGG